MGYRMTWPTWTYLVVSSSLVIPSVLVSTPAASSALSLHDALPISAQATSWRLPALRSAWTTVWVPVQVIDAPGATVEPLVGVQPKPSRAGVSLTVMTGGTLP